jgi:hypothetical protein
MALSNSQILALSDSIAQAISDFNTNFITGTATPTSTINAGVGGQGASATVGRVLVYAGTPDLTDELALLTPVNTVANQVAAYLAGIRGLNPFLIQYFPLLNAMDTLLGGLNAYLVAQGIQVNAFFAAAFNLFSSMAVSQGLRSPANIPVALAISTYFPYAAIDTMWGFTASGATTFSANAVGANPNTSGSGGGIGQFYIYKVNSSNAAGGAAFTITYTNAAGVGAQVTYSTVSGTPAASGSLAAGYAVSGAIGSAITAVTGSGMTSGEQYTLGMKLVRATAY